MSERFPIRDVSDVDLAFPASVKGFLPPYEDLPKDAKGFRPAGEYAAWGRFVSDWFYRGLGSLELKPREGVDEAKALRHIKYVMGSWEPKHEHKMAGVVWLLHEWFESVERTVAKRREVSP